MKRLGPNWIDAALILALIVTLAVLLSIGYWAARGA
jgi:hypothetical protein